MRRAAQREGECEKLGENLARIRENTGSVVPPPVGVFIVEKTGETRPISIRDGLEEVFVVLEHLAFWLPEPKRVENDDDGGNARIDPGIFQIHES